MVVCGDVRRCVVACIVVRWCVRCVVVCVGVMVCGGVHGMRWFVVVCVGAWSHVSMCGGVLRCAMVCGGI